MLGMTLMVAGRQGRRPLREPLTNVILSEQREAKNLFRMRSLDDARDDGQYRILIVEATIGCTFGAFYISGD